MLSFFELAGLAAGSFVGVFLIVWIAYGWSMLVNYFSDKYDASISRYRDKVSRRRAERAEINQPDPKPEDSASEKHEPHLDEPFFRYGINPFGLGSYPRSWWRPYNTAPYFDVGRDKRRDYEWFYLGEKQDD